MTTEIAIRQPQGMTLPDKIQYAKALADSNLLPTQYRRQPANLLFALEYAEALGVSPINAITSIHVIEGKPSASADLIASLVRRAGHRLRVSGDDSFALAQIIRADDPEFTFESRWDLNKARAAGLAGKAVWKNYPGAMLRARAITEVARAAAPDALFGVSYTPEELGAEINGDGDPIAAPSVRPDQPAAASASDRLRGAITSPGPIDAPEARERERQVEPQPDDGDVVDAEVVAEPERVSITRPQLTALNAGLTALGYKGRPAIYALLTQELGREIGSSQELSKDEASALIDRIQRGEVKPPAAEPEPAADDPDELWAAIVGKAPEGWSTAQLENDFTEFTGGVAPGDAVAADLAKYLEQLRAGAR